MRELGFGTRYDSFPVYTDNTSTPHIMGNGTYNLRVKRVALRYFFIHEPVEEGTTSIRLVKTEDQVADMGTKRISKHRHRYPRQADQRVQRLTPL